MVLRLRVRARSKKFSFSLENGFVKAEVRAKPEMGKANLEIEKEFRKIIGSNARIISGFKSPKKLLLIEASREKVLQALNKNKA